MAHQQESFHPFSSQQGLFCFLSYVAKGSTPKPCGPNSRQSCVVTFLGMVAMTGFKFQCQSSSAAPFPTPPTISYPCQHSHILPALLGCHSKSGQVWPHVMEPIFTLLHRLCNQGELLHSYVLGGSHSLLPGSKQGHSYLTYL